jgi:hypothetical protein
MIHMLLMTSRASISASSRAIANVLWMHVSVRLAGRLRIETVFLTRDFLYVPLPLEHDRGAGRSEPSEWEGSFTPRARAPAPSLSSAGSPFLDSRAIGLLPRVISPHIRLLVAAHPGAW